MQDRAPRCPSDGDRRVPARVGSRSAGSRPRRADDAHEPYDMVPGARTSGLTGAARDRPVAVRRRRFSCTCCTRPRRRPLVDPAWCSSTAAASGPRVDAGEDARSVEVLRSERTVENPVDGAAQRPVRPVHVLGQRPDLPLPDRLATLDRPHRLRHREVPRVPDPVAHRCLRAGRRRPRQAGQRHADVLPRLDVRATTPHAHCPSHFGVDADGSLRPRRSMFAARLKWTGNDRPRLRFFVTPVVSPSDGPGRAAPARPADPGPRGTISVGLMSSCTT